MMIIIIVMTIELRISSPSPGGKRRGGEEEDKEEQEDKEAHEQPLHLEEGEASSW